MENGSDSLAFLASDVCMNLCSWMHMCEDTLEKQNKMIVEKLYPHIIFYWYV